LLGAGVFLLSATPAGATPLPAYSEQTVASGLSAPTAVAFLPGNRILVTEKGGALKLVRDGTVTLLTTIPVCSGSEMGLLGIAPHPDFLANGLVFLYRTKPAASGCDSATGRFNQVVTVQMSGDTVVPGSLTERLTGIRTDNGNHDGGALRIGPDRKLYVAVGDTGRGDSGGPGQSTNPYAQDLGALEGKILRLELDGTTPAAGNPFVGVAGARPEVYAFGFRNPFRMDFDGRSGRLWVGDVGQGAIEEIDVIQAGGNYAWPHCEGTLPAGCQANATPGPVIDPVFEYPHSGTGSLGRVVTGGSFAGESFGGYSGYYIFGDYTAGKLYAAAANAGRTDIGIPTDFVTNADGPVDIVFGPDGWLYYVAINAGELRRVAPPYPRPVSAPNARVSLVVAYQPCTAPNRAHGPPLAEGSCNPPVQQSGQLTVGAPGQPVSAHGSVSLKTAVGDPDTPADEADVRLAADMTDVRRRSNLSDYTGELSVRIRIRVTDKDNPPPTGEGGAPDATMQDFALDTTVPCVATSDPAVGASCTADTSLEVLIPGAIKEGRRAIWALDRIRVYDGGPDEDVATMPNTVFATQGVFIP
jgi:glucose/arabinose dehydrogenase